MACPTDEHHTISWVPDSWSSLPSPLEVLRVAPDPSLRITARPVTAFDAELSALADRLVRTMERADGVGIAAPQIGTPVAVAVISAPALATLRVDGAVPRSPVFLVNPAVVSHKGERTVTEGCLSLPGRHFLTCRPEMAIVQAQDLSGHSYQISGTDLGAQALMHELDHLVGILVSDHGDEVS